jgi:hypothetical protein
MRPGVKALVVEVVGGNGVWLVHGVASAAAGTGGRRGCRRRGGLSSNQHKSIPMDAQPVYEVGHASARL